MSNPTGNAIRAAAEQLTGMAGLGPKPDAEAKLHLDRLEAWVDKLDAASSTDWRTVAISAMDDALCIQSAQANSEAEAKDLAARIRERGRECKEKASKHRYVEGNENTLMDHAEGKGQGFFLAARMMDAAAQPKPDAAGEEEPHVELPELTEHFITNATYHPLYDGEDYDDAGKYLAHAGNSSQVYLAHGIAADRWLRTAIQSIAALTARAEKAEDALARFRALGGE